MVEQECNFILLEFDITRKSLGFMTHPPMSLRGLGPVLVFV